MKTHATLALATAAAVACAAAGCSPASQAPAPETAPPSSAGAETPAPSGDQPPTDAGSTPVTTMDTLEAAPADPFTLDSLDPDDIREMRPDGTPEPDVVFVPTPRQVVEEMLRLAEVGPDDVLYDLGSGDGRIPIAAARRFGTRGVGVDIDPVRIREAHQAAKDAKVTDKLRFIEGDLFETDLSEATVVTLYLLPSLNMRLRPTLLGLEPGTRIVSHNYHMEDWEPEQQVTVGSSTVYAWTVPEEVPAHLR